MRTLRATSATHLLPLAALIGWPFTASPAGGQCRYDVKIIDYPVSCGLGFAITVGLSLNAQGVVVGRYKCATWDHDEGFRWTPPNSYFSLPRPPGVWSLAAEDVNDAGAICGTYIGVGFRGFVYQNDQYTELPPLQGPYSWAVAINNAGLAVGARTIRSDTAPFNALVWSADNSVTDLGVMSGPYSSAVAINEAGQVTGWAGNGVITSDTFVWKEGRLALLGPIPGGFTSKPSAISDDGVIVGAGSIPFKGYPFGVLRAFVWKNDTYTVLGPLGGVSSIAYGISPHGRQVVGGGGLLWQDGVMHDLNDLTKSPPGFVIQDAVDVNNDGLIVAVAKAPGAGGEIVTFLLTPVGQPLGDLDNDCRVGIVDFLMLLGEWGQIGSRADLDGDGVVGPLDFAILLESWG